MEKLKLKNENVYIYKNIDGTKCKQLIKARTFIYKDYKFNLQGTFETGYFISDNATGVIIGIVLNNLRDIHTQKVQEKLDYFLENILNTKTYNDLLKEFRNCENIIME